MKKLLLLLMVVPMIGFGQSTEKINETLREVSNAANKACPMVVDEYVTLNTTFGGLGRFVYSLTVNDKQFTDLGISKLEWLNFKNKEIINSFCSEGIMTSFKDLGVNVIWKYFDVKGNYIGKIELNIKDCK